MATDSKGKTRSRFTTPATLSAAREPSAPNASNAQTPNIGAAAVASSVGTDNRPIRIA